MTYEEREAFASKITKRAKSAVCSQENFERLTELMRQKGVKHEAFELLADLRHSEQMAKEEVMAIKYSIVDTLEGFTDFEGYLPYEMNYLQVIRKMKSLLEWIPVEIKLPENGQNVFAHYKNSFGKDRIIRAKYLRKYQEEASDDELDFAEYSEEHDENFWPEGWYEQIDNWGDYSAVAVVEGEIDYWLPLPPLPEDL